MNSTLTFRDTHVFIRAEGGQVFLGVIHPHGNVMPELGIDQATLLAGELERAVNAAQRQQTAARAAMSADRRQS